MKNNSWFYLALGGIVLSVITLFMPILIFMKAGHVGVLYTFNIMDFIRYNRDLDTALRLSGSAPYKFLVSGTMRTILGIIAVLSLVLAVTGLFTLRRQRSNKLQLAMTVAGLIGIMIPCLVLVFIVFVNGSYYNGKLSLGPAPIVIPLAMIVSILAVTRRRNRSLEKIQRELMDKGIMSEGGDLE